MLNQIESIHQSSASLVMSRSFASEAAWVTGKWEKLALYVGECTDGSGMDFNVGIGSALLALRRNNSPGFIEIINNLRLTASRGLSSRSSQSLQTCHETLLQLHVLTEIETISGMKDTKDLDRTALMASLDRRLDILGAFPSNKQYLLGIRRAAMQLSR